MADAARGWHGATALIALAALVIQVVLVIIGESVLVTTGPIPSTPVRLVRFFGYFTIQSNLLVLYTCATLALDPARSGRGWRVLRLDALVGITVTGLVHWYLLRPLLNLDGWSFVTDKLLHVVVPVMVVLGWCVFGPRPRLDGRVIVAALGWPLAYMAYTVAFGAATGWYPYPFIDVGVHGYGTVALNGLGVLGLFLATGLLLLLLDRRLPSAPAGAPHA